MIIWKLLIKVITMALEDVKKFKIEIENACIPLSLKYEYLYSLNNFLEIDEYSFFVVDKLKNFMLCD